LDYKDLLKNKEIEAVDIVLPIDLNYKVTKDALQYGKHVFVEKPIAANLNEANKMLTLDKKNNKVKMVAENYRYRKVFEKAKQYIKNKEIGKPYSFVWNAFMHTTKENKYARTEWRKHHKYPGGFVMDGGVHNIAALRFIFGEVVSVNAFTKNINPNIGSPDTMGIQLKFENGIDGLLNLFFSTNAYWENRFYIFGDNGSIIVNDDKIILKSNGKKVKRINLSDDLGFEKEFLNFYYAVTKGKSILSSFDEAYKDFIVILNGLKSAESGKRIHFGNL
jgi:predicted dehydrogenase